MKDEDAISLQRGWSLVLWYLLARAVLWLSVAVAPSVNVWMRENQHLSGWAQGVFSALAVFAAYWMGHRQIAAGRKLEGERRAHDEVRRLDTVDALLFNACEVGQSILEMWDESEIAVLPENAIVQIKDSRDLIKAIDPFSCPSPDVVVFIAQLPRQLDELATAIAAFEGTSIVNLNDRPKRAEKLRSKIDTTISLLSEARRECLAATNNIKREAGLNV